MRATLPHIVILFADNLGWANVGYLPPDEISTPNIDRLAAAGLELDRHYTYKFCSPSRSALMSGWWSRLPFHVNIYNDDPALPGQGVPVGMTLLPAKLKGAATPYSTHFIGKWHIGMASRSTQIPVARGFDTSLGYFHATNSYFDARAQSAHQAAKVCKRQVAVDLWDGTAPAAGLNGTGYEERVFGARAVWLIREHGKNGTGNGEHAPFFLYYAFHTSCVGAVADSGLTGDKLQPDPEFFARFPQIKDRDRRANVAMVALMDEVVGNVTAALRDVGMWDNTLLLWSSDNGGAVHEGGGANVYPLRGGYENNWEGGIRVAAFVSGGFLPEGVRGTKLEGFIHEADWYSTFCGLAGVDPRDVRGDAAGLPPVDSLDVWPLVSGANLTSPRVEWPLTPLGEDTARSEHGGDAAYMAEGRYKLLVGERIQQAGWCGQIHPNRTRRWDTWATLANCSVGKGPANKTGCLFDVLLDPGEHRDLALEMPAKAAAIYSKMLEAEKKWFDPDRGVADRRACEVARATGFWSPFLP